MVTRVEWGRSGGLAVGPCGHPHWIHPVPAHRGEWKCPICPPETVET